MLKYDDGNNDKQCKIQTFYAQSSQLHNICKLDFNPAVFS